MIPGGVVVWWCGGGFLTDYNTTPTKDVLGCWLGCGNTINSCHYVLPETPKGRAPTSVGPTIAVAPSWCTGQFQLWFNSLSLVADILANSLDTFKCLFWVQNHLHIPYLFYLLSLHTYLLVPSTQISGAHPWHFWPADKGGHHTYVFWDSQEFVCVQSHNVLSWAEILFRAKCVRPVEQT